MVDGQEEAMVVHLEEEEHALEVYEDNLGEADICLQIRKQIPYGLMEDLLIVAFVDLFITGSKIAQIKMNKIKMKSLVILLSNLVMKKMKVIKGLL